MVNIDSIFFDVDGTLVDSTADIANAVNHALRALKLKALPKKVIASYIGTGTKDLIAKSLGERNAAQAEKALRAFSEYFAAHPTDNSTLYPHAKETLEYFRGKDKYILTNRYAKLADVTLKNLGIRGYFTEILGGDDDNCLKPAACVLDSIITKFNIDKGKTLVVGDMAIDIMTARNSGVRSCWVKYGLGSPEEVEPLKPDFIISDLSELKKIIK